MSKCRRKQVSWLADAGPPPPILADAVRDSIRRHGLGNINLFGRNTFGKLFRSPLAMRGRRQVWMDLRRLGYSYPEIAWATGLRNHSTVVCALRESCVTGEEARILCSM